MKTKKTLINSLILLLLTSCEQVYSPDSFSAKQTEEGLSAMPVKKSIIGFMKGIAYTSWQKDEYSSPRSDTTLSKIIKPMGVEWISLLVTGYQENIASTEIKISNSTPSDNDLTHVIQYAHNLGMKIMLKPHIDLMSDPKHWRGQINFDDNVALEKWFKNYTDFILHYAGLAQNTGIDFFAIGTELSGTSSQTDQWRAVVKAVRTIYSGPLIYAANWDEVGKIVWWDSIDAIGVDAYYPLTQSNQPSVAELKDAWTPIVSDMDELSRKWSRSIVFTEIGYRCLDGTNQEPYNYKISGKIDLQEQADCYQAVFDAFEGKDWWRGAFWWNWTPNPEQGGSFDLDYTANNKPAENILRAHYGASPRSILIEKETQSSPNKNQKGWLETSPDGRYGIQLLRNSDMDIHYQIVEIKTGRLILTTRAQYPTPNDIKAGGFSSDSKKLASVYHYSHEGNYSWIGVWSTENGNFLYSKTRKGWTKKYDWVFDNKEP